MDALKETVEDLQNVVSNLCQKLESISSVVSNLGLLSCPPCPNVTKDEQHDRHDRTSYTVGSRHGHAEPPLRALDLAPDAREYGSNTSSASMSGGNLYTARARPKDRTPSPYAWSLVTHKRQQARLKSSTDQQTTRSSTGLAGAPKIKQKTFFLSNISLDSTSADVAAFCEEKEVTLTSCYMFPSKIFYGTLCAKIAVDVKHGDQVLSDGFWPTDMRIRPWRYGNHGQSDPEPSDDNPDGVSSDPGHDTDNRS